MDLRDGEKRPFKSRTSRQITPSVPVHASSGEDNREAAKALPLEMANTLIHLRCHAKCAERHKMGGTSQHLPARREVTKSTVTDFGQTAYGHKGLSDFGETKMSDFGPNLGGRLWPRLVFQSGERCWHCPSPSDLATSSGRKKQSHRLRGNPCPSMSGECD